mmetsp:Transcript_1681/g.3158  ORF Transcript_1681/g.3158 Transcript_1681/m.3158 type:complete len:543 (-) Transcript_1681:1293-2921(-)
MTDILLLLTLIILLQIEELLVKVHAQPSRYDLVLLTPLLVHALDNFIRILPKGFKLRTHLDLEVLQVNLHRDQLTVHEPLKFSNAPRLGAQALSDLGLLSLQLRHACLQVAYAQHLLFHLPRKDRFDILEPLALLTKFFDLPVLLQQLHLYFPAFVLDLADLGGHLPLCIIHLPLQLVHGRRVIVAFGQELLFHFVLSLHGLGFLFLRCLQQVLGVLKLALKARNFALEGVDSFDGTLSTDFKVLHLKLLLVDVSLGLNALFLHLSDLLNCCSFLLLNVLIVLLQRLNSLVHLSFLLLCLPQESRKPRNVHVSLLEVLTKELSRPLLLIGPLNLLFELAFTLPKFSLQVLPVRLRVLDRSLQLPYLSPQIVKWDLVLLRAEASALPQLNLHLKGSLVLHVTHALGNGGFHLPDVLAPEHVLVFETFQFLFSGLCLSLSRLSELLVLILHGCDHLLVLGLLFKLLLLKLGLQEVLRLGLSLNLNSPRTFLHPIGKLLRGRGVIDLLTGTVHLHSFQGGQLLLHGTHLLHEGGRVGLRRLQLGR